MNQRQLLIEITNKLLISEPLDPNTLAFSDKQLAVEIQKRFQEEIVNYYHKSEFKKEIKLLSSEERILNNLARKATGISKGAVGYLPKLHKNNPSVSMECTLASSFLKLAFEDMGLKNIRTCLLKGHQTTIKLFDDNSSIQMYDAANTHTTNGKIHGFSHLFTSSEVKDKKTVKDRSDEKQAFTFVIKTTKTPQELNSGMLEHHKIFYVKKFYAHDPHVLVSLSVILGNLDSSEVKKDFPFLKNLNYKSMREKFNLLDIDKYLFNH